MQINGYLSNQLGFSEVGRHVLDTLIKPKIKEAGITVLDPFKWVGEELDFDEIGKLKEHDKVITYWTNFNAKVTVINNKLMQNSKCMLAILDGGHAVDDGVASEIGYYAALEIGPIFGLRTDFRLAENMVAGINPQVMGYITQSGGELIEGANGVERWAAAINDWAQTQLQPADSSVVLK